MRTLAAWVLLLGASAASAEDPVFSGPQAGEKLAPFKVKGVLEPDAGRRRPGLRRSPRTRREVTHRPPEFACAVSRFSGEGDYRILGQRMKGPGWFG